MASQSSVGYEKDSTMDIGGLPGKDESPHWMSRLFEKLDLEVDEEDICSTGKKTKNDVNPQNWDIDSLDKEYLEGMHPAGEEPVPDQDNYLPCHTRDTNGSTSLGSSTCPWSDRTLPVSHSRPLIGARYLASDEEAKEYDSMRRRLIYGGRPRNEMERMTDECLLAFKNYVQDTNLKDIEYKFGELCCRCCKVQDHGKMYQHFNFTIQTKLRNSGIWTSKLYFAEVKELSNVKYYFCCPLEATDDGDCYECERQQIGRLKHPCRGGYEGGYSDEFDPRMVDYSSDSDADQRGLLWPAI